MKKVIIIGGKGLAVVVAEHIQEAAEKYGMDIAVLGFAFDDPAYAGGINGWPVLCGTREAYPKYREDKDVYFVFTMWRPDLMKERTELRDSYGIPEDRFLTFVHPTASVCRSAELSPGVIVNAGCVIQSNVKVGFGCVLDSKCMVGHDSLIGKNNYLGVCSCIGSGIEVGGCNFIGMNSTYKPGIKIGSNNIIGMCSAVLKDVGDDKVLAGVPARAIKRNMNKI